MTPELDQYFYLRHLKRRLFWWRIIAVLAIVVAIVLALHGNGFGLARAHVERLQVSGLITEDRS